MGDFMKAAKTMLKGADGQEKISSKRVITFMFAIVLIILVLANTFFGCAVEEFMFNGLSDVLIWSLGFIGSEQFAGVMKRRSTTPPSNTPPKPGGDEHEEF